VLVATASHTSANNNTFQFLSIQTEEPVDGSSPMTKSQLDQVYDLLGPKRAFSSEVKEMAWLFPSSADAINDSSASGLHWVDQVIGHFMIG
ncbi:hypothetical protein WN73_04060, partial [Bradyrhizobium sp. CCBAU 45394]|uniref:hypothetical protein n=1 Tax=Bradyrhizobium sp. CCBAU 45394 TaxID=1325087 RepID=UPI002302DA9A